MKRLRISVLAIVLLLACAVSATALFATATEVSSVGEYYYSGLESQDNLEGVSNIKAGLKGNAGYFTEDNGNDKHNQEITLKTEYDVDKFLKNFVMAFWFYISDIDDFKDPSYFQVSFVHTGDRYLRIGISKDQMKQCMSDGWNFMTVDFTEIVPRAGDNEGRVDGVKINGQTTELSDARAPEKLNFSRILIGIGDNGQAAPNTGLKHGGVMGVDEIYFYDTNAYPKENIRSNLLLLSEIENAKQREQNPAVTNWADWQAVIANAETVAQSATATQADYEAEIRKLGNFAFTYDERDITILDECDTTNRFHGTVQTERMSGAGSIFFAAENDGQSADIKTKTTLSYEPAGLAPANAVLTLYVYISDVTGFTSYESFTVSVASGDNDDNRAARWKFAEGGTLSSALKNGWNYLQLPFREATAVTGFNGYERSSDIWDSANDTYIADFGPDINAIKYFKISFGKLKKDTRIAIDRIAVAKAGTEAVNAPRAISEGPLTDLQVSEGITVINGKAEQEAAKPEIDRTVPKAQAGDHSIGWIVFSVGTGVGVLTLGFALIWVFVIAKKEAR